jgi:hypothetical protein
MMEAEEQFSLQTADKAKTYVYVNTRLDYQYRSKSLDDICLYDYIRFYRKKVIDERDRKQLEMQSITSSETTHNVKRGRPSCNRDLFNAGHPQHLSHINIKRTNPVVPVLIGPLIPRSDREDTRETYCRSILTLFHPWRSVTDLCELNQTWKQAYETRQSRITPLSMKIIENIQQLQECKKDRDEHLQQIIQVAQTELFHPESNRVQSESDSDDENTQIFDVLESIDITETTTTKVLGAASEKTYFDRTLEAVNRTNRFANIQGNSSSFLEKII